MKRLLQIKELKGLFLMAPASPGNSLGRGENLLPKWLLIKTCQLNRTKMFWAVNIHQTPRRISRSDVQVPANSPGKGPGSPSACSVLLLPCRIQLCHGRGGSCRCLLLNQHTQVFTALQKRWEAWPFLLRNPTGSWKKLKQQANLLCYYKLGKGGVGGK